MLGFPGASAPYWEFRGFRPSLALIEPTKGPVLFRRIEDRSVWIRFGWGRSDNWLPVEDLAAERALDVARRDRLQGKDLAVGARVQAPLPGGGHHHAAGRPLLQDGPPSCPEADHSAPPLRPQKLTLVRRSPTVGSHGIHARSDQPSALVLPDYDGACIANVVPALLRWARRRAAASRPGCRSRSATPSRWCSWSSTGWDGNSSAPDRPWPRPSSAAEGIDRPITSVAPTTTACALTSITTGCRPAGTVSSATAWPSTTRSSTCSGGPWAAAGPSTPAAPSPPTSSNRSRPSPDRPAPVPVVSKHEFGGTGFTAAHLGNSPLRGLSGAVLAAGRGGAGCCGEGERFVYAYYDGIDKVAHGSGLGASTTPSCGPSTGWWPTW